MFCHDTRPCFSITHSRTPITTYSNQFFETIYIADLSPTDNFHLIHPPYFNENGSAKFFTNTFFKISFDIILFSSITMITQQNQIFSFFPPLYTIIVFLSSLHLSNHCRFFSFLRKNFFNDRYPCVKRIVKKHCTNQKKVTVSCVHRARDRARYEARNWPQSGDPAT